jgi:hypothetical protein
VISQPELVSGDSRLINPAQSFTIRAFPRSAPAAFPIAEVLSGMLILRGAPALSPFRLQKLHANLAALLPSVQTVYAEYVHFADTERALEDNETALLKQLLQYGPALQTGAAEGELFFVVPRFGTISPWASKATDIAHNSALRVIQRLERGIAYYVKCSQPLTQQQRTQIGALLHDRMVETVLPSLEDSRWWSRGVGDGEQCARSRARRR